MAVAARQLFETQAEVIRSRLAESTKRLAPLADPLAMDFGLHRWLAADREEAYSDWLQWILQQIQAPADVFRLLGVPPPEDLQEWRSAPPMVGRELPVPEGHVDQTGRLDLLVRYERRALFVLEVKKTDADQADTRKQTGYKRWLEDQPEPYKYPILIAVDAEEEIYEGFRLLRWSDLCIGLRHLAGRLATEGQLVVAALTLALTGAVEQNLLGFSAAGTAVGNPAGFNLRLVAHLERWISEKIDEDAS